MMALRPRVRVLVLVSAALGLCAPRHTVAQDGERTALDAVRKKIEVLEKRLAGKHVERDSNARALKSVELKLAEANRKLLDLREQREEQLKRRREIARRTQRVSEELGTERQALAEQVRMSYMAGRQEIFKLLLSQESPATLGRMLVYYDYFNRARSDRIGSVLEQIATLAELSAESERVERRIARLERDQASEAEALARSRDQRRAVLAELDASIAASGSQIKKLKDEEQRLSELVDNLETLSSDLPVDLDAPFSQVKGKLGWPVAGRLIDDYGQPRAGGALTWHGVVLRTTAGTPVRAVYHGRVAYADWLPGLGLLIIVDHGNGYMSLYGHNEVLLKESGDWVAPGEVIAQVGDTGGRVDPALYFEIRRNGKPVNPHPWMRAGPETR